MNKPILYLLFISSLNLFEGCAIENFGEHYISKWKTFYPSKALDKGMHHMVYQIEDFSKSKVESWIAFNEGALATLSSKNNNANISSVDARLLKTQMRSELKIWKNKKSHEHSLVLYSSIISNSLPNVISADFLTDVEKTETICDRIKSLSLLCQSAIENLISCSAQDLERGQNQLEATKHYLNQELPGQLNSSSIEAICPDFNLYSEELQRNIQALIDYSSEKLKSNTVTDELILGKSAYENALALYTDSKLTPDEMAEMALNEIKLVKQLIAQKSIEYISYEYPEEEIPPSEIDIIAMAFEDMEKDAPKSGAEYLSFWKELAKSAVDFLNNENLVTLPEHESLRIISAPESAGPAARIGWVDVAPPFAPNPFTTLYLPSIPDTLEEQEQIDFWSSFNKPFNRMIVIHELYPGHYMQYNIARETPHPVRLLFPYGPYSEGWATFCEVIALDAGWDSERPLTYIAHLRKRLENANRAYTSIMVHCNGWNEEKVLQFSTETSLLAPQFAKSLWGRLMSSPMQLTSYFLGGQQFRDLLEFEKQRLGSEFVLKEFMDTILKSGPIPIDEFYGIFEKLKQ